MKAVDILSDGTEHVVEFKNYDIQAKYGNCNYVDDTYGDKICKDRIREILLHGCLDHNPRPHYSDGIPAHTISINHYIAKYDLSKQQFPIITLRPIATKSAIGELLWIYKDASNDLDLLKDKYNITWWDEWEVENTRTIGQVYGATVKRYDLMHNLIEGIKKDPDGRRHIMSLWQENDFKEPHGLKPCAFMTIWNVRHVEDKDYLDMVLVQRSSDSIVAGEINCVQYSVLLSLVARNLGYTPGVFTWFADNIQIYDRHIEAAELLYQRKGISCIPKIWINPNKTDFYDMTIDDIKIVDYPMKEIKERNSQVKLDLGI